MILSCEMVRENENGLVQFSYSHLRNELIDNLLVTSSRRRLKRNFRTSTKVEAIEDL